MSRTSVSLKTLFSCKCFRYLRADWIGVLLTDDREHAIKLASERHVPIWTDSNLKYIDPTEQHQICILSRVLDHIMEISHKTLGITGLNPQ